MNLGAAVAVTTPSPLEIRLVRTFAAPRELVFAALTEPDLLKKWYGARGWWLVGCEIDLCVGGRYRFVSRGPGGAEMASSGVYREILGPARLVYTERYDDQWFPDDGLVTADLTGRPDSTTLTTTLRFATTEVRDLVLRSPMERGLTESYGRLDDLLTEQTEEAKDAQ
jgi:uncharacterized protein YndB with AHSA1/START domain